MLPIPQPLKGICKGMASASTPTEYTEYCLNVRPRDTQEGKLRISQRPGLAKYNDSEIGDEVQPIVAMCAVKVVDNLES